MADPITRREILAIGAVGVASTFAAEGTKGEPLLDPKPPRPYLTPGDDFTDVSRGDPVPHTLTGEALIRAQLTPSTWRLEIVAQDDANAKVKASVQKSLTIEAGNALDLPALMKLSERHGVRFLKAMQCQNIALPLGHGLWEGVLLRDVLALCGKIEKARRVYYWGYHNDKPEQRFQSSLAISQVFDAPPGDLPPFLAYRLNGAPISLKRGGPVRLIVPWAHGFKSIKWLQRIVLTNDCRANDTYADDGNDPESYLKTAAYFENVDEESFDAGVPIVVRGTAIVGLPGLERVEYWLRPDAGAKGKLALDDPAWASARWTTAAVDPPPSEWAKGLVAGSRLQDVWGFDQTGKPKEWPMRYSIAHWTATLGEVPPGAYELRVRTVDKNGFAQPAPRPGGLTGRNMVQCKIIHVRKKS